MKAPYSGAFLFGNSHRLIKELVTRLTMWIYSNFTNHYLGTSGIS